MLCLMKMTTKRIIVVMKVWRNLIENKICYRGSWRKFKTVPECDFSYVLPIAFWKKALKIAAEENLNAVTTYRAQATTQLNCTVTAFCSIVIVMLRTGEKLS